MRVISLELNEINFDFVSQFAAVGKLPTFAKLLERLQLFETISEERYPLLEPWIQWPTVYTGLPYDKHGVFRLGDAVLKQHEQIWEKLEAHGFSVGAISPMNAANRCRSPNFFIPDPWTNTKVTADPKTKKLFDVIRGLVNDNAKEEFATGSVARQLLPLALGYLQPGSIGDYLRILPTALKHKWAKAAVLDLLLADLLITQIKRHGTQFSSLFLNAGAHIQHHHMFDSAAYEGNRRNPDWYSTAAAAEIDPLLFIYQVYDRLLARFEAMPDTRILISTGLSQCPNEKDQYQYRPVEFSGFMKKLGVDARIEPRMSRDFLLAFDSVDDARQGAALLNRVQCCGKPLFCVDERGETLFCQVGYFGPPEGLADVQIAGERLDLRNQFVLVSIENGIHQTKGYHLDTAILRSGPVQQIELSEVHERLIDAVSQEAGQLARTAAAA